MAPWEAVLARWVPWAPVLPQALQAALQAVDPGQAVRRHLRRAGSVLHVADAAYDLTRGRLYVLALGKAAYPMAQAVAEQVAGLPYQGLIVTKDGYGGPPIPGFDLHYAGHPVPDARSLEAAGKVRRLLAQTQPDDLVLVLLSGGGSALLVDPAPGLTLDDLQALNRALLRVGATIHEINTVRKHVERLKGGGLARLAQPAWVHTLVLSDVLGDDFSVIASGPTWPDPTTYGQALEVLRFYGLLSQVPRRVVAHLETGAAGRVPETPKPEAPFWTRVRMTLVAALPMAVEAAARTFQRAGWHTAVLTTTLQGEAREVGRALAAILQEEARRQRPLPLPAALLVGGETTVTVQGQGRGGRNQEMALAAVPLLAGLPRVALVTLSTDGTDGPTDAAGAVATGETWSRSRALGLDPQPFLAENDAYTFWDRMDALLRTGPTRTNVNDLAVLLCGK